MPDSTPTRWSALLRPVNAAPRTRRVWSVAVVALLAATALATAAWFGSERFYRFQVMSPYVVPACLSMAGVLYAALAPRLSRLRAWLWVPLATAMVSLAALLWFVVVFLTAWTDETPTGTTVVSPDGRYEAVELRFVNVIDPSCRVMVRERGLLLSRQVEVWRRVDAPCPARIEFVEETQLQIVDAGVAGRAASSSPVVSFDPETMTAGVDDDDGYGD